MASIRDLPLDVWVVVFCHFEHHLMIDVFRRLVCSNVFAIDRRLDTFWTVISRARGLRALDEEHETPDGTPHRQCFDKLREMGVPETVTLDVVRRANGEWDVAMDILGW